MRYVTDQIIKQGKQVNVSWGEGGAMLYFFLLSICLILLIVTIVQYILKKDRFYRNLTVLTFLTLVGLYSMLYF